MSHMNKLLVKIAKILCLYIPFRKQKWNFCYGLAFSAFYLIYTLLFLYLTTDFENGELLTSLIQAFMLFFVNLMIITRATVFNRKFERLVNTIEEIHKLHTKTSDQDVDFAKNNYTMFAIVQIGFGLFVVSGYHVWGYSAGVGYYLQMFPEYIFMTTILLEWEFLNYLHRSIEYLNQKILDGFIKNRHVWTETINDKGQFHLDTLQSTLNVIAYLVEKHEDVITFFNEHFGWNILLSTLIAIHYLLGFFADILDESRAFNIDDLFAYFTQVYNVCQGIMIPIKCEHVVNERNKTAVLLQKLLNRYAKHPILANKLTILMQHTTMNAREFTAAGFFGLNYNMLFTFINMIITYLVVIIQFSNSNKG